MKSRLKMTERFCWHERCLSIKVNSLRTGKMTCFFSLFCILRLLYGKICCYSPFLSVVFFSSNGLWSKFHVFYCIIEATFAFRMDGLNKEWFKNRFYLRCSLFHPRVIWIRPFVYFLLGDLHGVFKFSSSFLVFQFLPVVTKLWIHIWPSAPIRQLEFESNAEVLSLCGLMRFVDTVGCSFQMLLIVIFVQLQMLAYKN